MRLLGAFRYILTPSVERMERKLEVFIDDLLHYIINKYDYTTYFIN